jgi:hypothetical protein
VLTDALNVRCFKPGRIVFATARAIKAINFAKGFLMQSRQLFYSFSYICLFQELPVMFLVLFASLFPVGR